MSMTTARRPLIVVGMAVMAIALGDARPSYGQAVRVPPANPQAMIDQLTKRVADLENLLRALDARVKKLEKDTLDVDDPGEDKTPKEIESKFPKSLTVRAPFTIVDDEDRTIMRVVVGKDGPSLTLTSNKGTTVVEPHWLSVTGPGNKGGVQLGKGTSGNGGFLLSDKTGNDMVSMGFLQSENRLSFKMYANDRVMVDLGENDKYRGSGALRLGNGQGTFTAELATNPKNEMALRIRNRGNQVVAGVGVDPDGTGGALKVANDKGVIFASVVAKGQAGHVNIFGEDGRARANMGAEPDGRGFVRVGTPQNVEAASLTVSANTGGGVLQVKDQDGIGVTVGAKQGTNGNLGDVCVNSFKSKGMCFSVLAAKSMLPYF